MSAKTNALRERRKTNVRTGRSAFRSKASPVIWEDAAANAAVRQGKENAWAFAFRRTNVVPAAKTVINAPAAFAFPSNFILCNDGQNADFFPAGKELHTLWSRHRVPCRPRYILHQAKLPYCRPARPSGRLCRQSDCPWKHAPALFLRSACRH